jgi:hypothetical protein
MNKHETINYLEMPARDLDATKRFFRSVFQWTFTDYGPDYVAFATSGIDGGFYRSVLHSSVDRGAVLVVFYSEKLEETQDKITAAGGAICKPVFDFPGGRRFHFTDPNNNEFAVWSDK